VTRIQKYSSYSFTVFLAMHITNNALIPLVTRSVPASEPYLLLTRPFYQSWPLAEPAVVIVPLLAHISAGVALRAYRRMQLARRYGITENYSLRTSAGTAADAEKLTPVTSPTADPSHSQEQQQQQQQQLHPFLLRTEKQPAWWRWWARWRPRRAWWPRLSGTSALGYVLVPLALGHAALNRLLPWWVDGSNSGIGLDYVSHGFARDPALSFAGYTALLAVGSLHIVWGAAKWLGYTPDQVGIAAVGRGGGVGGGSSSGIGSSLGGAGGIMGMGGGMGGGASGSRSGVAGAGAGAGDGNRAWRRKRRWYVLNALSAALTGVWMAGGLGVVGRDGAATGWVGRHYDELFRSIPLYGNWLYS
jgi:hypothetical protein